MINIKQKSQCCGCQACYNVCPQNAIEMLVDKKGFKYPSISKDKCVNCNLCEKVCPMLINSKVQNNPEAYACINKNEQTRMESSSGGIFTLIASVIIEKGGVVFGASWNEDFTKVVHTFVDNIENLKKFRGAKYLQSDVNETYIKVQDFLKENRYVLFSGTPCQIEGLRNFLGKDYEKLILQDIICHGVPSPKVWNAYKNFISKQTSNLNITNMEFRNKENEGWNKYHLKMCFKENKEYNIEHTKDIYMKTFLSNMSLRDSCTSCKFKKINRISDITLADFWGINNILPEMNDNKGTSLVIINSEKGKRLFEEIKNDMICKMVDLHEAIKYNPSMNKVSLPNKNSNEFFNDLDCMEFDKLVKKYVSNDGSVKKLIKKIKNRIKNVIK